MTIPVFLASDGNYAPYLYSTLLSCLHTRKQDTYYEFFLLIPPLFPDSYIKIFEQLPKKYNQCTVTFVNMEDKFSDIKTTIPHISNPTYYRLLAADILRGYDKAIYLDTDVIVTQDLSEYYNQDLEDYYIGGVKALAISCEPRLKEYYRSYGVEVTDNYINAGVTLWNLKLIRKDDKTPELLRLSKERLKGMDQDVINIAFYKKIKTFPFKYNMMTKYLTSDTLYMNPIYRDIYGKENVQEALSAPVIIHYADKIKPWQNPRMPFAKHWWVYFELIPYDLISNYLKKTLLDSLLVRSSQSGEVANKEAVYKITELKYGKLLTKYYIAKIKAAILFGSKRKKHQQRKEEYKNLLRSYRQAHKNVWNHFVTQQDNN